MHYGANGGSAHAVSDVANATGDVSINGQNITYTPFNRVTSIIENGYEEVFTYDANYNRVMSVLRNGTTLVNQRFYIGGCEYNNSSSPQFVSYICGGDGLAAIISDADVYYTYKDNQNSILTVTDNTGDIVAQQGFDAWGRYRNPATGLCLSYPYASPATPSWLHRGYTGQEHMNEFDLINLNARLYDPTLSRMLSPDNYVQAPYNTQNYNRYSYCMNNPTNLTDPTGNMYGYDDAIVGGVGFVFGYLGYAYSTGNWASWGDVKAGLTGAVIADGTWNLTLLGGEGLGVTSADIPPTSFSSAWQLSSNFAQNYGIGVASALSSPSDENEYVGAGAKVGNNGQYFLGGIELLGGISAGLSYIGKQGLINENIDNATNTNTLNTPLAAQFSFGGNNNESINFGSVIGSTVNGVGTSLLNSSFSKTNGSWQRLNTWDFEQAGLAGLNSGASNLSAQLILSPRTNRQYVNNVNGVYLTNTGEGLHLLYQNLGQPGISGIANLGFKELFNMKL
jgi:RHS repeat-associated protein